MERIGFIGFGSLGQLLGKGFNADFAVSYYDPAVSLDGYKKHHRVDDLVESSEVVMIATPASSFDEVLSKLGTLDLTGKLIVDVLSAKTYAAQKYAEVLPDIQVLSLHPLFGPPSYTQFEQGLRVVSCFKNGHLAEDFEAVLVKKYGFKIIHKTPEEHDKHMAIHHAIPFFLAHALSKTDFKKDPGELTIPSEEKLRKIVDIAGKESIDLYLTIMKSNPHAKQAVENFLQTAISEHKNLWP